MSAISLFRKGSATRNGTLTSTGARTQQLEGVRWPLHHTDGSSNPLPMTETLFMMGTFCKRGHGCKEVSDPKDAMPMQKEHGSYTFSVRAEINTGPITFASTRESKDNGFAVRQESILPPSVFAYCSKCGVSATVANIGDFNAVALPGPEQRGWYKVTINLLTRRVSYECAEDDGGCWPHTQPSEDLIVMGKAVCGDDWKEKRGTKLRRDPGTLIWRGTVHMCPSDAGFKFIRSQGNREGSLGNWPGSFVLGQGDNMILGGSGHLKQAGNEPIPGPVFESMMEVAIDMSAGTYSYHCVKDCELPPEKPHKSFHPENPVSNSAEAFVHLFMWKWNDVAVECEQFLGPRGYKAAQVSPPQESKVPTPNSFRHGADSWSYVYRPVSYKLDSRLGSEHEFVSMIKRCHDAGVDIYVDAIINHMAGGDGQGCAGSNFGKRAYEAVGYVPEDFHHNAGDMFRNCNDIVDVDSDVYCHNNCKVFCDYYGMPDLDTSSPRVQRILAAYLNKLIDYGVAGFRIDAADHIPKEDMKAIFSKVKNKYRFVEYNNPSMDVLEVAAASELQYTPRIAGLATHADINAYRNLGLGSQGLLPSAESVVFVMNHDWAMHYGYGDWISSDTTYATFWNVCMLAHPYGYPRVFSSYYAHSDTQPPPKEEVHPQNGPARCNDGNTWVCEHRWPAIANMISWRKSAGTSLITHWVSKQDQPQFLFCRGETACIIINAAGEDWNVRPKLTIPPGAYCNVVQSDDPDNCPVVQINEDGTTAIDATVGRYSAIAIHTGAMASSKV